MSHTIVQKANFMPVEEAIKMLGGEKRSQWESGHSPWSLHWHLESTTINSNGKVIREREEDFRSNIPGLSGENFNSQPEVPSHDLEWNSPYLNSMRLQQQGLERLMEQQQLDMQEEMSKMIELFWR